MELLKHIIFYLFVALTLVSAAVVVFHKRIIYPAFALLGATVRVHSFSVRLSPFQTR